MIPNIITRLKLNLMFIIIFCYGFAREHPYLGSFFKSTLTSDLYVSVTLSSVETRTNHAFALLINASFTAYA